MKLSFVKEGKLIFEDVVKVEQHPNKTVTVYFESGEQTILSEKEARYYGLI
jgi:hypothetical protein